jgi:hypothetical protein
MKRQSIKNQYFVKSSFKIYFLENFETMINRDNTRLIQFSLK